MQSCEQTEDDDVPMGGCFSVPVRQVFFLNQTQYKVKVTVTPKEVRVLDFLDFNVALSGGAAGISAGVSSGLKLKFNHPKPNAQEVIIEPENKDHVSCPWSQANWTVTHAEAPHMYKSNQAFVAEDGLEIIIPRSAGFACHCLDTRACPFRQQGCSIC